MAGVKSICSDPLACGVTCGAQARRANSVGGTANAGAGSNEPAISVYEISQAARDASRKLQESRWTLADRFARGAPQRLDVLEENLSRIAAHLGVELLKYEPSPEMDVDARETRGSRSMVKRASTSMGLRATPIGSI